MRTNNGKGEAAKDAALRLVAELRTSNGKLRGRDVPTYTDKDYEQLADKLERHFRRYERIGRLTS